MYSEKFMGRGTLFGSGAGGRIYYINPLNAELNPICHLLALLGVHFLHVRRIRVKSLTLSLLMSYIYRVSQEECARHREGVPYVKVYRYNPKHLCPKLNGYGSNGQKNCGLLAGPRTVPVS